jgi:small conductance mechanosensitive channel
MAVPLPSLFADPVRSLPQPWETLAVIALIFIAAWIVLRFSGRIAAVVVRRMERRAFDPSSADTGAIASLKRRDTTLSLVRTTMRYAVVGIAVFLAATQLAGISPGVAVASASLIAVIIGFAAQRFLIDILTGFFMFFEGWFSVGDMIIVEPHGLVGAVEEVSLRATKLRAVNGETLRVHNSQIQAVRVLPRGVREVSLEVFVRDGDAARRLVEDIARVVPTGPTHFLQAPWVAAVEALDDELVLVQARATVAPGREWLAHEFLPQVLAERAEEGLIVHGPVVMDVDEIAARRYARTLAVPGRRNR